MTQWANWRWPEGDQAIKTTASAPSAADAYAPVPFDPAAEAVRLQRESPAFAQAWAEQGDELAALDVLLSARQRAGLTQAQVAELMGVKQSALARVEGALHGLRPPAGSLRV